MSVTVTLTFASLAEAAAELAKLTSYQTPAEAALRHTKPAVVVADAAKDVVATANAAKAQKEAAAAAAAAAAEEHKAAAAVEQKKTEAKADAAPKINYATLSTAVLKLMKVDADAPSAIAKSLGFETFKKMKEAENADEVIAKAHAAVTAKLAEVEGAGV